MSAIVEFSVPLVYMNAMGARQEETDLGGTRVRFMPTRWTQVVAAGNPTTPEGREALEAIAGLYWKPLYFYLRRGGKSVEDAKDLTQGFFAALIEKNFLRDLVPRTGRFRSFLLAAVGNYSANEWDRARTLKRGGRMDFVEAETEIESSEPSPERAFMRQLELELLNRALERLKAEVQPGEMDELLSPRRSAGEDPKAWKEKRYRLRRRLKEILREELRSSVENESELEDEIAAILNGGS